MLTPLGTRTPPRLSSRSACRDTTAPAGYSRSVSWITIVSCKLNSTIISASASFNANNLMPRRLHLVSHPVLPLRVKREQHQAPRGGDRRALVPGEVDVLAVVHNEVLGRGGDLAAATAAASGAPEHRAEEVATVLLPVLSDEVEYQGADTPVEPPRRAAARLREEEAEPGHLGEQVLLLGGHRLLQLPDHVEDLLAFHVAATEACPGDHISRVCPDVIVNHQVQCIPATSVNPVFP
ncbi:Os07g0681350 [Oryza sativa Japonica Group]|uniref:Os07g0681350 protein n=1 Tax=Oryza sativa subsp. japonica TaxID=39947 RepID=A0A0P0XAG9_ORYSJ|nr:hypothetical protein EE612_041414 [Oryza sativa]BAT03246.1 Os07g0681350 [Oryza sativa Japonica Group]